MTTRQTVFLVEDDERMRVAIELLLRTEDFAVQSYPHAELFLAAVTHSRSICLLTDVRLPGMDGLALHRRLLAIGAAPTTVMITGHGDIPMAVSAVKEGVMDFIEKPFHPPALVESMKEASRRALAARNHEFEDDRLGNPPQDPDVARDGSSGPAYRRRAEQGYRKSPRD